ncbi:MAG: hypothetical protein FH753_11355 [Firmicutes bacterium]|nr:hypothetical protein [Bacillota bacterium]
MLNEISGKLDTLEYYTEVLYVARSYRKEDFIGEPLIFGGTERYILLGIKEIKDICRLVGHYNGLMENDIANILDYLDDKKILKANLKLRFEKYLPIIKVDYLKYMDKEELYEIINEFIDCFSDFKICIESYYKKDKSLKTGAAV